MDFLPLFRKGRKQKEKMSIFHGRSPFHSFSLAIEELIEVVAERLDLSPELICSGSRKRLISDARALLAYLVVEETGHSAAEVTRFLGISCMGVQKAVIKGRELGRHGVSLER